MESNSNQNIQSGVPTDENPRVPPGTHNAFPYVQIFTKDKAFGEATLKEIRAKFSNAFGNRGILEVKKAKRKEEGNVVEFYPSLGNLLGTVKGEEAATTEAILAFVLSMLTKMGAR